VDPAALPGGVEHDLAERFDQTAVAVGDDQADAAESAFSQVTQELGPEGFGLAVADHDADDFAAAVLGDAGGDDDGLGGDAVVDAGFDVGGVEEEVGQADVVQWPGAEGAQLFVELSADSGDLTFRYPGVGAEGFDQVVDGAGGDAVDVCLHDDRVEGLVDAPAAFEEAGEEASGPLFRDGEFQVAGLCGHGLLAVAIAPGGAGVGVLTPFGADFCGGLGLDQFLKQPFGDLADEFKTVCRT
jgi:hypothetical protein